VCIVAELRVTVNYIKVLNVAEQCFYYEFVTKTITIIHTSFEKNHVPTNFHSFRTLQIKAELKQKNVLLLMAFLDIEFG
jgi:hypothetical protein